MPSISSRLEETKLNRLQKFAYNPLFWIVNVVENIFLVFGSILLLVFAIACLDNLLFFTKAKSVQGTIIELVPNQNVSSEYNFLKVAFREETTKGRYIFISSISTKVYNEDEKIKVFYDPENPEDAKIGNFENLLNLFGIPIFLFLLAAFFFLCPLLSIGIRRRIRRQK